MNVELAARRPRIKRVKGPPLETLNNNFLSLNINYYQAFIALVAAIYVNEKTAEATRKSFLAPTVNMAHILSVKETANRATGEYLRNVVKVRPGKKNEVTLNYYYNFQVPTENNFHELIRAGMPVQYGAPKKIIELISQHQNWEVNSPESLEVLTPFLEDSFLSDYDGIATATLTLEEQEGSDGYFRDVTAVMSIKLSGEVYTKYVDGDDFSPYLAYMMVNNMLSSRSNRTEKIYDPRKISSTMQALQKRFGSARPRLNEQGFGIAPSGTPIFVPKQLDRTKEFIDAADNAIDDDGEFNLDIMVEKGFANSIIYVDWLNDILAYTTSHARMQTLSLRGVMELDASTEKIILETPITDSELSKYLQTISLSLADVESKEAIPYLPKDFPNKEEITQNSPASLQARLSAMSGTRGRNSDICLKHLAGLDLENDFPEDTDIKRAAVMFAAYAKLLKAKRTADSSALQMPDTMKSLGIYYRLMGVEYYLHVLSTYTQTYMDKVRTETMEEKNRQRTDLSKREFSVPNIALGSGFNGFLPHQARISSSLEKSPRYAILPVQTGGGKSILSIVDAVFAIQDSLKQNIKLRPLISTKGRLVKGTITEINRVSEGKLNAIPLRAATLGRMKRMSGIKTFAHLMDWYSKLPPNTIFVNSYSDFTSRKKIYDDLPSMEGFANEPLIDSQYLRIIKLLNIQMIIGDESHLIKNPTSNRTKGAYSAFSNATHRHIMSGTILSNTAADLIGQAVAVSPVIFGNRPEYAEAKYGISRGIIKDDETASKIKERMQSVAAYHQATKDEWSYMLPIKEDDVRFATMTPLQEEFYDELMREAYLALLKGNEDKESKDGADEDDEDEEEADEDLTAEDAEEEKFLAKARLSLSEVEQFLAAPDENEQYVAWDKKPKGDDLVSPKVRLADKLIAEHMAKAGGDKKQNKIIIFGVNHSAIRHFHRHSKYAGDMLVYWAGDDETIRKFATDEKHQILLAAETALREGENLQMTSLIIRLQSVWAPGDHEQAIARMYRPDPRGKYNRDSVSHIWTMVRRNNGNPSLDGVKMARLISKFVSNARITYEDRKEWKSFSREVDDLEMLRMNMKLIFESEREDVDPYFAGWKSFVGFESRLNYGERMVKANELEARYNIDLVDRNTGKIKDINQFVKLAMAEVKVAPDLPGSKRVYVPWSPNAIPPDPDKFGFVTLGMQPVSEGQVVLTEFGPGIIQAVGDKSVKVRLYGDRVIGLRKSLVAIPSPKRQKDFDEIVKNPSAWAKMSFAPHGETLPTVKASAGKDGGKIKTAKEKKIEQEIEDEAEKQEADVLVSIINGMPALVIQDEIEGLDQLEGWLEIDPFISLTFRSWSAALNCLEELDSKTHIPEKVMNRLMDEVEDIKTGKYMKIGKPFDSSTVRDFFAAQRKRLGSKEGKPIVHPYWIAIEDDIRLAFDIDSHDQKVINWLKKAKTRLDGVAKISINEGMWVNIFKTIGEARRDLSNLVELVDFDEKDVNRELRLLNEELRELMKPRKRPLR